MPGRKVSYWTTASSPIRSWQIRAGKCAIWPWWSLWFGCDNVSDSAMMLPSWLVFCLAVEASPIMRRKSRVGKYSILSWRNLSGRGDVSDSAMTKLSRKVLESVTTKSLIRPWRRSWVEKTSTQREHPLRFSRDEGKSMSLRFNRSNVSGSAVTKTSWRVFDSVADTPSILLWWSQSWEPAIPPWLKLYDSVIAMPSQKVFDSSTAISLIKLEERAARQSSVRPFSVESVRPDRPNGDGEIPSVPLLGLAEWKERRTSVLYSD